jgi:hypothetical protein
MIIVLSRDPVVEFRALICRYFPTTPANDDINVHNYEQNIG